jgi:hypothetical protein
MKIIKTTYVLELQETLEDDVKYLCDKPYFIERLEKDGEIIWFGYKTNWRNINNQWFKLEKNKFIKTTIPEYEIRFQNILKNIK